MEAKYKPIFKKLQELSGQKVVNFDNIKSFHDSVLVYITHNVSLPEELKAMYPTIKQLRDWRVSTKFRNFYLLDL